MYILQLKCPCILYFSGVQKEWDFSQRMILIFFKLFQWEFFFMILIFSTCIYCTDFSKLHSKAYQFCQLSVSATQGTGINDHLSFFWVNISLFETHRWQRSSTEAQFQTRYSFVLRCDETLSVKDDISSHQEIFFPYPHTFFFNMQF